MGSITVVNLTDSPIQSAIANAGNIHSGINGILPHAYYHHNALSGTGYEVWEKWYIPGIVDDFPSSDLSKIGWYVGGAVLVAAGIVATVVTAGAVVPAWAAMSASSAALTTAAIGSSEAMAAALAWNAAFGAFMQAAGATALGAFIGVTGIGLAIGSPIADYIVSLEKQTVGSVWGQNNRILSFTGKIPLETCQVKDCEGQTITLAKKPADMTAKTALPPQYAGDLTPQVFDMMRRKGEIYQIKHRGGEYGDLTQGFVRLNLRGGGGKEKQVTHGGITLDISRIYKIFLLNSKDANNPSCLRAGADEGDNKLYLMQGNENQLLSCCYWQFIPTREQGGGWIIVDRCNVRALCWSDGAIHQYPSEEPGINIVEGWATNVSRGGMVWDFSLADKGLRIAKPGVNRVYVTAHKNDDSQIDAIPLDYKNALQTWVVKAVNDGSDFKAGVGLSGFVYLQDDTDVPLVNDKFAGTRGQSRRVEAFQIKFNPPIPNLNLEYMAHLESTGDSVWVQGGGRLAVGSQSRRMEGFAIRLTGSEAKNYSISYMASIQDFGDTDYYHDGEFCGTRGQYRQIEGIQVHVERR